MELIVDLSGIGGLAPRYYGDLPYSSSNQALRIIGSENQYAKGVVNPIAKLGYLSPANGTFTATTGDVTTVCGASIADSVNSKGYFFERGTKMLEIDSFTDLALTANRTIASATGSDLEIYSVNGARKLFYSYQKASGGDIGIYDFASTYNDTWLSATCTSGFLLGPTNNHKMIVADNGFMYILDGSALHKIDGTTGGGVNGTATNNVLLFPAFFQLIDGIDHRGKIFIAMMQSSRDLYFGTTNVSLVSEKCGVYVWDRQSTTVTMSDYIPIDGIREIRNIFSFRGVPHCFTVSSSRYTQLRRYNGNEFEVIKEFSFEDYPRFPDSVHVNGDLIIWLGNSGEIHTYGKIHSSLPEQTYEIGDMSGISGFSYGGALLGINASESTSAGLSTTPEGYYLSIKTSTGDIKKWYPHAQSPASTTQNPATGNFYTLVKQLPKLSLVNGVTIFYPPISTSGSTAAMYLDIYLNQSSTTWGQITLTRDDAARGWKYIPIGQANVNSIQLGITWNTSSGISFAITPSYAKIDYIPTGKLK